MPLLFLFLFLAYPIAEIAAIFWLADTIGGLWTFFWIGAGFLLGSLMLMHHQLALVATVFKDLRAGTITPASMFRMLRYYLAAILFMIPGPISDVIALLLLLPWAKSPAVAKPVNEDIIEGDYRRVDPARDDKLIR